METTLNNYGCVCHTSIHNQFRINGGVFITKSVFAYYSIKQTGIYRLCVIKRVGLKSGLYFILINLGYLKKFYFLSRLGRLHYAQMKKFPWYQPRLTYSNIYIFLLRVHFAHCTTLQSILYILKLFSTTWRLLTQI